MPRTLPVQRAMQAVLTQIVNDPRVTVTSKPETDAYDHLPMVIYTLTSGERVANADLALGETWAMAVSVCAKSNREAEDIAASLAYYLADLADHYPVVAWAGERLLSVSFADVSDMPTRAPVTATVATDVVQYNSAYSMILTP